MRDPVFELRRIPVPRTRVNRPQEGSPRLWGGLSVLKYCSSSGVEVIFGDYLLPVVGWIGGREKSTNKGGGQAPSTAEAPPHRIRLQAAMHSSLDTFSTPAGVPTRRPPFVDVSGVGRTPIGPGGPRRLEMCSTPSDRSVISLSILGPPPNHRPIRLPNVSRSVGQRSPSGNLQDKISLGLLVPLFPSSPITRTAQAAAGVPRHRRVQHHHRPGAQHRPHAPVAWRGCHYRLSSRKPDRRRPGPPGHGPSSSRRLSGASIAPLPRSRA